MQILFTSVACVEVTLTIAAKRLSTVDKKNKKIITIREYL